MSYWDGLSALSLMGLKLKHKRQALFKSQTCLPTRSTQDLHVIGSMELFIGVLVCKIIQKFVDRFGYNFQEMLIMVPGTDN